jgi:hypothetical protein
VEIETFKPGSIELDPTDFNVGDEWNISGWEGGTWYMARIRVERNVVFRRRFYVVSFGEVN